jgi:hypothetical protein
MPGLQIVAVSQHCHQVTGVFMEILVISGIMVSGGPQQNGLPPGHGIVMYFTDMNRLTEVTAVRKPEQACVA